MEVVKPKQGPILTEHSDILEFVTTLNTHETYDPNTGLIYPSADVAMNAVYEAIEVKDSEHKARVKNQLDQSHEESGEFFRRVKPFDR